MFYDKISLFGLYGYKFITPIELKNESRQIFPIIVEKITEYEGIKVCYRILIYNSFSNVHFESVSILGHKFDYVFPLYQKQLEGDIGSIVEQFELYTKNNITNNLNYFKYDINNIKLFTNDTYVGMKLYQESLIASNKLKESLIARDSLLDDRISNTTNDSIEEQKLIDDINRHIDKNFESSSGFENFKTTVSDISENEIKVDLKKQLPINDLNVLKKPYEHIVVYNNIGEVNDRVLKVNDINNIDENIKKMLYAGLIIYSAKHNSKYVYQGDNKWKPLRKENKNKDKLLNVDKEKSWKRI